MTARITVVHQARKQLFETLVSCRCRFEYDNAKVAFTIYEVFHIGYDRETSIGPQMFFTFNILDNNTTNMVVIQVDNILEMRIEVGK